MPLLNIPPPSPGDLDAASLQSAGEIRLLVLDDDLAICRLIQASFIDRDFKVVTISDPALMEKGIQAQNHHLVILDWVLPGLETNKVLEWLQTHQPEASVIVVTAYPSMDSALHSLRAHVFDYLTKPFQVELLKKTVLRCLASKGLLRKSEEALREEVGAAVRERRKAQGLTLAELAKRTNISLGYLSQIELGKNSASIETLYRIALGLSVPLQDFFQSIHTPT